MTALQGVVRTARLDLVLLPVAAYRLLLDGRLEGAEALIGARLGGSVLGNHPRFLRRRLAQLETNPLELPWLVRAMVLRKEGEIVGDIGFHGPPDAEGMVEIGYSVAEPWRRQGLATEAALGLSAWATGRPGVRRLRASIGPSNTPSLRVAGRLGLVEVGRQVDDEDGEEIILERSLTPPKP